MDFIKNEVMEIKEKMVSVIDFQQQTRSSTPAAGSSRSPSTGQNTTMVGCDDVLEEIMDKLTRNQHSNLQVVPIVGMGGMGKTTLAQNVYENPLIVQRFDVRAWATISQNYSVKEILVELLLCQKNQDSRESLSKQSEVELRDRLRKGIYGRRYLIILDDMWNIEAWDKIKSSFPDNKNGSRVIITTRQSNVALHLTGGCSNGIIKMEFLNDNISWNLLCQIVFGSKNDCPSELKKNGRKIVKSCNGLPLAIVVIGGLLAKSKKTPEYWKYIAKNLHSLEENEYCLNLLYTSYNHLPVHLKPCFLYMGIYFEQDEIAVYKLVLLWVAEGFLKPVSGKSLEEVACEYLKDLADRNLILVVERDYNGDILSFKIHDLLKDLCLRESQKDKFLFVTRQHGLNNSSQGINTERRVAICKSTLKEENQSNFLRICDAFQSASLARTLVCYVKGLPFPNFRLLRVLESEFSEGDKYSVESYIFQLVNLRLLVSDDEIPVKSLLPSSLHHFWNIQILIVRENEVNSFDIWKMPLLRFVLIKKLHLRNPGQDDFVLGNLQHLQYVANFRCSEQVVKRIPNIKVLDIIYDGKRFIGLRYCLNNLARLCKLEKICLEFREEMPSRSELLQNLTFPHSLKELILMDCGLHWEDISTKIGSLPLLEMLVLWEKSFIGPKWETIEGQFCSLKILRILECSDLKCWNTDSTHFPCLERLVLRGLGELEEIPSAIGDIPTLQLILLWCCSYSVVVSAKEIAKEQEELENQDLHVEVMVASPSEYEKVSSWASPNFRLMGWLSS